MSILKSIQNNQKSQNDKLETLSAKVQELESGEGRDTIFSAILPFMNIHEPIYGKVRHNVVKSKFYDVNNNVFDYRVINSRS
jgi:hypothetical protein